MTPGEMKINWVGVAERAVSREQKKGYYLGEKDPRMSSALLGEKKYKFFEIFEKFISSQNSLIS